ncbi:MAG: hypothetical protein ACOX44_11775 [Limnochordia bacterium]
MFRKVTASFLLVVFMVLFVQPVFAAETPPLLQNLTDIELALWGAERPGALLKRIKDIETELGMQVNESDTVFVRVEALTNYVSRGPNSLMMKMSAIEWAIFRIQNSRLPLRTRLDKFEEQFTGELKTSLSVTQRLENLVGQIFATDRLNAEPVELKAGTEVRIKLITELATATTKQDSEIEYYVARDIIVDGRYAVPIGAQGLGTVLMVKKPGPFGQSGQMQIDLGSVTTFDGTKVPLTYTQPETSTTSSELAAGASLSGMVLLGPLGLAAGYLIKGSSEVIPSGTELIVHVKTDTTVQGLSFEPYN